MRFFLVLIIIFFSLPSCKASDSFPPETGNIPEAKPAYKKLIAINPKLEAELELPNLYMSSRDAVSAQTFYEPIYSEANNEKARQAFLNKLLYYPSSNLDAKIRLGYIEINKGEFQKAREIFQQVLAQDPNYKLAKMGIVHSYMANNDSFKALDALHQLPEDEDVAYTRARVYYSLGMLSDAKSQIKGSVSKNANELKYKIKEHEAITVTTSYSLLLQQLADNYKLDINEMGIAVSQNIEGNRKVFLEYNMYVYSSGQSDVGKLNNVTNEFRMGTQARPHEKLEYKLDAGVKGFEFGGALANTDSWVKYYFSDKLNAKFGFSRNNVEQSYLSAVGRPINGIFTGRDIDNKTYLEFGAKYAHQYYSFGHAGYGVITGVNMPTNQYMEGMLGFGKVLYNNADNKWVNMISADVVSYNASYQYNLPDVKDNAGTLFGGYFSPGFYTADTFNLKAEGTIKKWHLKYGLIGFFGGQVAITPNMVTPTGGVSPYVTYNFNDHIAFNAAFNYFDYADVQRYQAIFSLVIRGFRK